MDLATLFCGEKLTLVVELMLEHCVCLDSYEQHVNKGAFKTKTAEVEGISCIPEARIHTQHHLLTSSNPKQSTGKS